MIIGENKFKYKWIEKWASIPDTKSGRENGRTHGVAVSENSSIIVFNQADPAVLFFDKTGKLIKSWGDRFGGAHGLTLVKENGTEYLWLTDQNSGEVVKTDLDGNTIQTIEKPDLIIYENGVYSPTWVAVNPGNGDIWVTDGYGSGYVHRYSKNGSYIESLNGEEGGGRFNCPHSLFINERKSEPELYIADRGNERFQVYDLDGNYKRNFGSGYLDLPCGCITFNNYLLVPELNARITILDEKDELTIYLGRNERTCGIAGWPNHPEELIQEGKFNSPHALAADAIGNLYIVEWIIGGRIIKLEKV